MNVFFVLLLRSGHCYWVFSYLNIQKNSSLNISLYTKSYSLKKYLNTIMKYSQSSPYLHLGSGIWSSFSHFFNEIIHTIISFVNFLPMYLVKPTKIFCVQFENWQGPTVLYHLLPIIIYKNILAHILWMSNTDVVCVIVITIPLGGFAAVCNRPLCWHYDISPRPPPHLTQINPP